ncbi:MULTISPECIES: hypothetical protein [unclassified Xanthomonas]|uniref:hypothetical protein n=1 Tax=unclassified Xanthomonas TaxID=2643310 RepID=UPI002A812FA4|nr:MULTISPECIES: hypothetical protein [unclassified Xanthomonas]MDY4297514.1 hypothetical protein [Xanthomonas sp. LF02-5]MDY4359308.1 hypothetical protein [Xanthomonas sp. LF04-12]
MLHAQIVPATAAHIDVIAASPRPADVAELWAEARRGPAEAMHACLAASRHAYTAVLRGSPVCMFGAAPYSLLGGTATVWMIGSTALDSLTAQRELVRLSRPAVAFLQDQFPAMLFNLVDDRNAAAKRWLRWLGFTLIAPITFGPDALPFRPFYRSHPNV